MGIFKTLSLGDSVSVAQRKLLRRGVSGSQAIYKFAREGAGGMDIKDQISSSEI